MFTQAQKILKELYGYDSFRSGQEQVIKNILAGHDSVGIMPTGGGKSVCYQIPAMILNGVTIVISPLISLMKDQVDSLKELAIPAVFINSSQSFQEVCACVGRVKTNQIKLLYVAPERLRNDSFIELIKSVNIAMIAVDEAHCVSQWGHDFRPSYMSINDFVTALPKRPVVTAFTATATETVRADIIKNLALVEPAVTMTGFDRPNLYFDVVRTVEKTDYILAYLAKNKDNSGIIYAATRKETDELYEILNQKGISAGKYHAGLSDQERHEFQDKFLFDDHKIIVATNAFGMGIDKSNVRFVIHNNMPKNMESYYQEAGRAGRDGLSSECILLYAPRDVTLQKYFIDKSELSEERKINEFIKLQAMKDYCHTAACQRNYILNYFGDSVTAKDCGNCGSCTDQSELIDMTIEAQKILSCVARMKERYGITQVIRTLKGSKDKNILENQLDKLSTYGIMAEYEKNTLRDLINLLASDGYLEATQDQFSVLKLTDKSKSLLRGQEKFFRKVIHHKEHKSTSTQISLVGSELFRRLKAVRKTIADLENVPPYVIFHDSVLNDMALYKPSSLDELIKIKGIGAAKLSRFGTEFLVEIIQYSNQFPDEEKMVVLEHSKTVKKKKAGGTWKSTYEMFQTGLSIEEIMELREFTAWTIQEHIITALKQGLSIDYNRVFSQAEENEIMQIVSEIGSERLKPIKDLLPERFDYFMIKLALFKNGKLN